MTHLQAQWHSDVHQRWGNERLVFWRFGFYPTYRRQEVLQTLEIICGRHGIRGRVVYEVFGQHDMLARFWLPGTVSQDDVDRDLKRTLAAFHLELCDMFVVDDILRHWFWDEGSVDAPLLDDEGVDTPPPVPHEDDLVSPPTVRVLRETIDLVELFNRGEIDRAALEANDTVRSYLGTGVLGIRRVRQGIKFGMIVSTSGELSSRFTAMEALGTQLERILVAAEPVMERSLYSGSGFGRFLILGKIAPAEFFSINSGLIEPIVDEASLAGVYRTRSVTYIGSNPMLLMFSEAMALPPSRDVDEVDIDDTLAGGENARVEFKGSVFTNINRWLHQGERVDDDAVVGTFAQAVVAMLNGNGGVVVSGVLESSIRDYGSRVSDAPRRGDLIILGTEFDWYDWKRQEWDEFENRLRQKLASMIEPNPLDFLTISQHDVEGRTLCAVLVAAGVPRWYYLRKGEVFEFAVRRGASSDVISGPLEESYKRMAPRGV